MSKDIKIKNGLNIKLKGAAYNIIKKAAFPKSVSINPSDFHLIVPKMAIKVGEKVSQGDVVFFSKKAIILWISNSKFESFDKNLLSA